MTPRDPDLWQHIGAKLLAAVFEPECLDRCIAVFHRWIQQDACEELLIDVADYRHLRLGPGVILVGHEANYSLDRSLGRPGLLYNRKTALAGTFETKLIHSLRQAYRAARRLEEEQELKGLLRFDYLRWEILCNDRLLAPNCEASWATLEKRLRDLFAACCTGYGGALRLERVGGPRDLLRAAVTLPPAENPAAILDHFLGALP